MEKKKTKENKKQTIKKKTEKRGKWDTNSEWAGIWQERWKTVKWEMNTVGLRIWRETTKFVENEKCIL